MYGSSTREDERIFERDVRCCQRRGRRWWLAVARSDSEQDDHRRATHDAEHNGSTALKWGRSVSGSLTNTMCPSLMGLAGEPE
jgi:hypothetical protein